MTSRWHDSEARKQLYRAVIKTRVEAERRVGPASTAKRTLALPARRNLSWLAAVYGSDKGVTANRYVDLYADHLRHLRSSAKRVLEIGIYRGASLQMWRDYFPHAEVYGVDIKHVDVPGPRIHTMVGDQSDPALLRHLADLGPWDLIIDDGSHVSEHVIATFHALFDTVTTGGYYVIEDLHTAYFANGYGGGPPGDPDTSATMVKDLVDALNRRYIDERFPELAGTLPEIRSMHVYEKICFIERGVARRSVRR